MDCDDPPRVDAADSLKEPGKISVIGERECCVHPKAVDGVLVQSPAGQDGRPEIGHGLEFFRAYYIRGTNERMPRGQATVKYEGIGKLATGFAAGGGHFGYRWVREGRDPGLSEDGLDLLGLAQRIGQESWHGPFLKGLIDEVENHSGDFVCAREDPFWGTERGFHYKGVCLPEDRILRGETAVQLEVSRIEEGFPVLFTSYMQHGRSVDVTCREELQAVGTYLQGFMKGLGVETFVCDVISGFQNVCGRFRAEDILVAPEMIRVGMRDEAVLSWVT